MPSRSLLELSFSMSWSMAVYLSWWPSCLTTCHLAVVLSIFGWFDTSHYYCQVQSLQNKVHVKSRRTGLRRLGLFAEVRLWRQYPLVEEIIYIDMFKSCTLRRHLSFRTLDVSISCLCLSLVLSINSPNATTLHSRCIWGGVLRVV